MLLSFAIFCLCSSVIANKARYQGNPDEVVFPGPVSRSHMYRDPQENEVVRSLELAKQLSKIQTEEEFLRMFQPQVAELSYSSGYRIVVGAVERSRGIKMPPALCQPELQVVPVKEDPDPAAFYFPNCIRIHRCGGCCNSELLSCQPNSTEIRNYEIHVTKMDKETEQYNVMKEIVPLEVHTSCLCDCRIKEQDCNERQYYSKDECRCICKNSDEERKCNSQHEMKYWNGNTCACQCRKVEECSTGFYFDQNLCSCKNLPFSRHWFNDEKRTGYNFRQPGKPKESPPLIVTLDANDPRRKHKEDPEYK